MNKKVIAGALVAGLFPALALAQTTDVSSQIQSLLQQIQALQQQLKTLVMSAHASSTGDDHGWMMGSTTPPGQMGKMACITLSRNLGVGSQGDDVKGLQQMLGEDPENDFHGSATGFFGPLTAHAMMMFQMHNGIASTTTGSVGPLTRGFFERRCGNGLGGGMNGGMNDDRERAGVTGTITANGGSSITIQNNDGKSVVVDISASTTIQIFTATGTPPTTGTISNLTVGLKAGAKGQQNADGSINAVIVMAGTVLPPPPMMGGDDHSNGPKGMMPTMYGPQGGPGMNGGPQNW